jgi:hypothetical protein
MDSCFGDDGFVPLKTGVYQLRVLAIIPVTWGKFGEAREWKFAVVGGTRDGCPLNAKTKWEPTPKVNSKFGRWYRAVLGRRPTKGEKVDLKPLIGKTCWAMVTAGVSKTTHKPFNDIDLLPGGKPDEGMEDTR